MGLPELARRALRGLPGALFLVCSLALTAPATGYERAEGPDTRSLELWKRCRGVDLGGRLVLTAAHCADTLPPGAERLVEGIPAGPFDYVVAYVPELLARRPLPCRTGDRGRLDGRPVRVTMVRPNGLAVLDVPGAPGISGTPVFGPDGSLLTMVVGFERDTRRAVALAPEVVCTVIRIARRKLEE